MSQQQGPWTVRKVLEWTSGFFSSKQIDSPRLSAELLLIHVLNISRIKLYTDIDRPMNDAELAAYRALVKRAGEHEPIAYLTGKAHFFNLEFTVTRDVLIPRPDTETLVENVMQFVRNRVGFESPRVLDLCTGSGCVAAAIAAHVKSSSVVAIDISQAALAIAKQNIDNLKLSDRVTLVQGDLFEPLKGMVDPGPFHLITANPPYISTAEMDTLPKNVKDYEPAIALDGGLDGLIIHRRILKDAAHHLVPEGRLYLEIAYNQRDLAIEVASAHSEFDDIRVLKDYGGNDRVLTLRKK